MKKDIRINRSLVIAFCVVMALIVGTLSAIVARNYKTIRSDDSEYDFPYYEGSGYELPNQKYYISGWDRCLDQLRVDCDVAFVGDSITYQSSFDLQFPDLVICNLGVCSDDIKGINYRAGTLETVRPEKVFLMIGINAVRNDTLDECIEDYGILVENILTRGDFDLYIISITPISPNETGEDDPRVEIITSFNEAIRDIAARHDLTYIDLYSQLADEDGYMTAEYTKDGLHLSDEGYEVWADCIRPYLD